MKINPEKIIIEKDTIQFKENIFLISGNEETLIKKIEQNIVLVLKRQGYGNVRRYENASNIKDASLEPMLFSSCDIAIYNKPKIKMGDILNLNSENIAIIINYPGLKNSDEIKKKFDFHKYFVSISCYKMSRESKKKYFDYFLNVHSATIENEGYWYFLDFSSDLYGLFENELTKMIDYKKKLSLLEIKKLLSKETNNDDYDRLFFAINSTQNRIVSITRNYLNTLADSYALLQRSKFYLFEIKKYKSTKEVASGFPKYLFKQQSDFINLYNKINTKKYFELLNLIKKTELLLRKNSSLFLPITQRFLLNFKSRLK